jgi:hypothetical protein
VADNDSAYVGAMRAVSSITSSLVTTLKALGFLGDPGLARFSEEMRAAAALLTDLMEQYGIPEEEVAAAWRAIPIERHGLTWERDAA